MDRELNEEHLRQELHLLVHTAAQSRFAAVRSVA
jgi:hypothetical protein